MPHPHKCNDCLPRSRDPNAESAAASAALCLVVPFPRQQLLSSVALVTRPPQGLLWPKSPPAPCCPAQLRRNAPRTECLSLYRSSPDTKNKACFLPPALPLSSQRSCQKWDMRFCGPALCGQRCDVVGRTQKPRKLGLDPDFPLFTSWPKCCKRSASACKAGVTMFKRTAPGRRLTDRGCLRAQLVPTREPVSKCIFMGPHSTPQGS